MSRDLDVDNFDVDVTLVNGDLSFGFNKASEVARFLQFVVDNPSHEYGDDCKGKWSCRLLKERYIDNDRVREPLGPGDMETALRDAGWLRKDADGVERMHFTRDVNDG